MHFLVILIAIYYISFLLIYIKYYCAFFLVFLLISLVIIIKLRWKGLIVLILGFSLSYISFNSYYKNVETSEFRVVKVTDYSITGESKGRKYKIASKENLSEGDIIKGEFKFVKPEENDLGIVASIKLRKYTKTRDLKSRIISSKKSISTKLVEEYGYDKGTLMSSLVLGTGSDIYEARKASMKNLGLMHILSISGFHIVLISNLLSKMKIKRLNFLMIFSYIYFIGTVAAYRVLYTILYKKLARYLKRDPNIITGIFFALFVQSFFKPYLLFNIGFILTYFSTLGIIIFKKPLEDYLVNYRMNKYIIDNISTTVAALTLTIPFIALLDSKFSLSVLIGSMLVVPIYILVTYMSFLAAIFMNVKIMKIILDPFIKIVFDFSYYLGLFLGEFSVTINLIYLKRYYYYFLLLIFVLIYKKKPKLAACVVLLFTLLSFPLTNEIAIISKSGNPYIRVSQKLRVYDIIDVRINKDKDVIELNDTIKLKLQNNNLTISKSENKNEIPKIYFNNLKLKIDNPAYKFGESVVARYIIFGERLIRVE